MTTSYLATLLRNFFEQHLVAHRGLSSHTVLAYRDTWKLFLQFTSQRQRKSCASLTLAELTADTVRRFLDYLEQERHNSVSTRNNRLAAVHAFFQYVAQTEPRDLAHCQSVLAVPFKRHTQRVPEYLERKEVLQIFSQINCRTTQGRRDDSLLRLLYNTGMRAQELGSLDVNHVRFSRPYLIRILGKGRKERTCPLWTETIQALKSYLVTRNVRVDAAVPLFVNVQGNRLTRFGLRHIIAHRVAEAVNVCPSLFTRKVTPHT